MPLLPSAWLRISSWFAFDGVNSNVFFPFVISNVEVLLSLDNINGSLLGRYSIDAKILIDICKTAGQLRCGEIYR